MSGFRSLSSNHRLQGFSLPEVVGDFEQESIRLSRSMTVNGRRLKPGPLINALVIEFLSLPADSRTVMAARGLAKLEHMMAVGKGIPVDDKERAAKAEAPDAPEVIETEVDHADSAKAVRRKKPG
jgi:hypothetical protein